MGAANCCSNDKVGGEVAGKPGNLVEAHGNLADAEKEKSKHAPDVNVFTFSKKII